MAERASRRRCRDVPDVQRARLLEAMAEVVADHGLRGASASRVASRAGVSRETFVKQFEDPDDCFLALLDWMLDRAEELIFNAFSQAPSWRDGVLDGLESLLGFLDQEPVRTRVCLLERVPANSTALEPRVRALDRLGLLVDERAREELSLERQPPAAMFEATIGSVLVLLRRRLLNGDAPPFGALLGELVEVVVAPYLGPSAAVRAASVGRRRAQVLLDASLIDPARHELEDSRPPPSRQCAPAATMRALPLAEPRRQQPSRFGGHRGVALRAGLRAPLSALAGGSAREAGGRRGQTECVEPFIVWGQGCAGAGAMVRGWHAIDSLT